MYNLTNVTNSTDLASLASNIGNAVGMGYLFGYFVLLVVFFTVFLSLKSKGYFPSACFSTACWVCTFTALFLRGMNLLDNYAFWSVIIVTAISVALLYLSGTSD